MFSKDKFYDAGKIATIIPIAIGTIVSLTSGFRVIPGNPELSY